MLNAGIDVGTRTLKVCLAENDEIVATASTPMEKDFRNLLRTTIKNALHQGSVKTGKRLKTRHIQEIVATGYGGHLVKQASKRLSEGVCLARGAHALDSDSRRVVSVGGLFIKSVSFDNTGFFQDEQENERCAAGSGRFLEMIASSLEVPFKEISGIAGESNEPVTGQNSCAVFAESEIISFVNNGYSAADILAGVLHSIAGKTATIIDRLGETGPLLLSGGVARIPLFRDILSEITGEEVILPSYGPEFVSAWGAALIAGGNFMRPRRQKITSGV